MAAQAKRLQCVYVYSLISEKIELVSSLKKVRRTFKYKKKVKQTLKSFFGQQDGELG